MKFTHRGLKINEYTKFISNGYLIEVIPDFTADDKHPDAVITVSSIQDMLAVFSAQFGQFEMHNIKIPVADLTSRQPTIVAEHDSEKSGSHIKFSFTGNVWTHRRCTIGTLEFEIINNSEQKEV